MKAVVMAGGEGSRLRPLTVNRPKPLVPICNRPIMHYIVELLKQHGCKKIISTLHYMADEIVAYFGDGSDHGVQMIYSMEDQPMGTAGSVKMCQKYLNDTFIIISGDSLTDFDLTEIVKFHKEKGSIATIALTRVENPLEYGVVITEEDGRIRRFLEKPSWGEVFSDTINTGIYVLEPEIFNYMEDGKSYDFSKDIFPALLADEQPMYGFVSKGYWCDIGNLQTYRLAHQDMFAGKVKAVIPGKLSEKNLWVGEGAEIHPSAKIQGPVAIGKNCRIGANVHIEEFTSIGDNCLIEQEVHLQRSILWDNVFIGERGRVSGSTICRNVTIKDEAKLSEGVILGDKCFIGERAQIQPQVKIWPEKHIEAGANVSMSMIWAIRWPGTLFGVDGIAGLPNIELTAEIAMKLGSAFGACLDKGAAVMTSRDAHPACRMLNRSLICGLMSVGVEAQDLRLMPIPVSRYMVRNTPAQGGVHTRLSPHDPRYVLIEFMDERGVNFSQAQERKIENVFFREDFRRTSPEDVGGIEFPTRIIDAYSQGFMKNLHTDLIKSAKYKVVIDFEYGNASLVLPSLLGKLGCDMVALNAYQDFRKSRESRMNPEKERKQLADIVTTLGADLGMLIDVDGEKLTLVDEKGNIISDHLTLVLFAMALFRAEKNGIITVPVNASSIIEKLAYPHGTKVVRTRTDGRSIMNTAALGKDKIIMAGNTEGKFIFPYFHPSFDAMFAFVKLLENLAKLKLKLSDLIKELPPLYMQSEKIDCSFQKKGMVMRKLIEKNKGKPIEMIEGVKVFSDYGWQLLLPDPSEPYLHLYVEGNSPKQAETALLEMKKEIESILEKDHPEEPVQKKEKPAKKGKSANEGSDRDKTVLPEERAFYFWTPGNYLGVKAQSFLEFCDALRYMDLASIAYHMQRGDFANWIEYELSNPSLAEKIRQVKEDKTNGEELRERLLKLFE